MSETTVVVQAREETGKNSNRRLRAGGSIPAVVYGAGKDSVPITVDEKSMREFLQETGSENSVFLLKLGESGKSRHAMIRDLQIDPISRTIEHIDFQRVLMDEKVKVTVGIHLEGTPTGVKDEGGVLDFVMREVEIESLPGNIPAELVIDISGLAVGDHVEASDIEFPEGVELMTEGSRVIASVAHSRVAQDLEEAEAAAEEGAGLIEEMPSEPEVIGREQEDEVEDED